MLAALGNAQLSGGMLWCPLGGFSSRLARLRLVPPGGLLDRRPATLELVVGPERDNPGPSDIVPASVRDLLKLSDHGARIRRPNDQFVPNFKISAFDWVECKGVPSLVVGVNVRSGLLQGSPPANATLRRYTWHPSGSPDIVPSSPREGLAETLHRHTVELKFGFRAYRDVVCHEASKG